MIATLLWLAEHWWIAVIVALAGVGGAIFTGLVSVAKVIANVLQALAAVVTFFTTPADQIAGKILYGIAVFCVAIWLGHMLGVHEANAKHRAADAAAQADAHKTDATIATKAGALDKSEQAASDAFDKANQEARNEYIANLEKQVAAGCAVDSGTLRKLRHIR